MPPQIAVLVYILAGIVLTMPLVAFGMRAANSRALQRLGELPEHSFAYRPRWRLIVVALALFWLGGLAFSLKTYAVTPGGERQTQLWAIALFAIMLLVTVVLYRMLAARILVYADTVVLHHPFEITILPITGIEHLELRLETRWYYPRGMSQRVLYIQAGPLAKRITASVHEFEQLLEVLAKKSGRKLENKTAAAAGTG